MTPDIYLYRLKNEIHSDREKRAEEKAMSSTATEVLKLLRENEGGAISGEKIAKKLGITRSAVWKHIKTLKEEGYEISSTSNKGYELGDTSGVFSARTVSALLNDGRSDREKDVKFDIEVREEVTSTNAVLKEMGNAGAEEGRIIIAKKQTEGRGRLGRKFFSPKNGLYLSILLKPDMDIRESMYLTTIAAVAVVEAIKETAGKEAAIKWVNDVYLAGRKICGILTEAVTDVESGRLSFAVVGIGVNITAPGEESLPEELREIAGFLYEEEEQMPKGFMNSFTAAIIKNYFKYYKCLPEHKFMENYKKYQMLIQKQIFVITPNGKRNASVLGVDDEARLLVEYENGEKEALFTGEVSVREAGAEKKNMPEFNKIKKTLALLLCMTAAFSITACREKASEASKATVETVSTKTEEKGYSFKAGGAEFVINENPAGEIEKLEAASDTFEAPSCAMQGEDKIYTYSGFSLTVHAEGEAGESRLKSVLLTDDSVETAEGLYIGMNRDKVEEIYGQSETEGNEYIYKKGNMELSIIFEDNTVVSIEYRD